MQCVCSLPRWFEAAPDSAQDMSAFSLLCSCPFLTAGRRVVFPTEQTAAADIQTRPSPHKNFQVPLDTVASLLLVWDFCQRYG